MKVKEIQKLTIEEIKGLSLKELRSAVNVISSAYNKRKVRLEASKGGKGSPAYQSKIVDFYGKGKFSSKGKDRKQLEEELARAQYFGGLKTSSLTGYNAYKLSPAFILQDRKHGGKISQNLANASWDAFNKIKEKYPELLADGSYGSEQLLTYLKEDVVGGTKYNIFEEGEIERMLDAKAAELYEGFRSITDEEYENEWEYDF